MKLNKKKRKIKFILSFFFILLFVMSSAKTSFAKKADIIFENNQLTIHNAGSLYTDTDLFGNFKNLMPGDFKKENIIIKNKCQNFDLIKIYLKAISPDQLENPLSGASVDSSQELLSHFSKKVYLEEELIFHDSPDQMAVLEENIFLGTLHKNETINLNVELKVPLELDKKYMNSLGEVVWVFTAEGYKETLASDQAPIKTSQATEEIPKTGESSYFPIIILLLLIGFGLLLLAIFIKRKDDREEKR